MPDASNPEALNCYSYAYNNPVTYTDPTGHWVESALDIFFIGADIADIQQNGLNWENGLALTADVVGLALPGVTGGGMAVRAVTHADDIVDVARTSDNIVDVGQSVNHSSDAARAGNTSAGAATTARATSQSDSMNHYRNPSGGRCSFSADTPVLTLEGLEAISQL